MLNRKWPLSLVDEFLVNLLFYLVFYPSTFLYFISIQIDDGKMFALVELKCPSYNVTANISFHLDVIIIKTIKPLKQKLEPSQYIVVIRS